MAARSGPRRGGRPRPQKEMGSLATLLDGEPKKPEEGAEEAEQIAFTPTDPPANRHYWWGLGRRKSAVARVRIRPGTGQFLVNKRPHDTYFTELKDRNAVIEPLAATRMLKDWDVWANVKGGGYTGQAGAVVLGLARALAEAVPDSEHILRDKHLLTRDARVVERKKYGRAGARRRFQFSKR